MVVSSTFLFRQPSILPMCIAALDIEGRRVLVDV